MSVNIGWPERLIRLAAGILILGLYGALPAPLALSHAGGAVCPIGTALRGYCPLRAALGGRRCMTRRSEAPEPLRFRSVLLPLDGSPFAEHAIPWAAAIARKARARLRLALVHQSPPSPPLDQSNLRLYTKIELAVRKVRAGVPPSGRRPDQGSRRHPACHRDPLRLSGSSAGRLRARGRRGPGGDDHPRSRWAAAGVARKRRRPDWCEASTSRCCWSARAMRSCQRVPALDEILVPLDGSRRAEAALPPALGMATLFSARLGAGPGRRAGRDDGGRAREFPQALDEELTALQRREAQDYLDGVADADPRVRVW